MNIYDKISRMQGNETYDEKMYQLLNTEHYCQEPYRTDDLGEEMSLIEQLIWSWWKPRFLLDHRAKCAYELMDPNQMLITITDDDIDWDSLNGLPEKAIKRAQAHSGLFPTIVYGFSDGVAQVKWQINPDGRYYQDDDGFGMTDDDEIAQWGKIDRTGKVVVPFAYRHNDGYK